MNQYPRRLFTFGCSLTRYHWPTWADILGQQFDYFENWGQPSGGNNFIFNSVIECDTRNNFTPNDVIVIMWTSISRIDYYQHNKWAHMIGKFVNDIPNSPLSCPDGYEIISYPLFSGLATYLNLKKINYKFTSWTPYDTKSRAGKLYADVLSTIDQISFNMKPKTVVRKDNLEEVERFYSRVCGKDWPTLDKILNNSYNVVNKDVQIEIERFISGINANKYYNLTPVEIIDTHPLPIDHYHSLKQIVPQINIKSSTVDWVYDITKKIQNKENYYFDRCLPRERL